MTMSLEEKMKVLGSLVKKTQKSNGGSKHVLSFASERMDELRYEFISTPSENLNMVLGDGTNPGGFAKGKIIEVAGESSSGKTSLMLETIGKDHQEDPEGVWGWMDTEGDWDTDYAVSKGIDLDRIIIWEVDDAGAETGLDTLEMLIRSNSLKGIVVNSVTGLTPKTELESEMEKANVALQARMMSKLMRKITAIANRTKTSVIFINQLRTNVGVMYGNPNTTTGGKALSYFASQRVDLNKVKLQKEDGITEDEGIRVNVRIKKNRASRNNPYKATSYTALYGKGIDSVREIAQIAIESGVVEKGGAWIYMPNKDNPATWEGTELRFQGQSKFLDFIRDNYGFREYLKQLIHGKADIQSLSEEEIKEIEAEEAKLEQELELELDLDEPIEEPAVELVEEPKAEEE